MEKSQMRVSAELHMHHEAGKKCLQLGKEDLALSRAEWEEETVKFKLNRRKYKQQNQASLKVIADPTNKINRDSLRCLNK